MTESSRMQRLGAPERGAMARTDLIGQVVAERFEIVKPIDQGGMGAVYEAKHVTLGRRFAVKFLRPELCADPRTLARFEQEAQAAGKLESEHICSIVDVGEADDGTPCLVMEYLAGESLADVLSDLGPLPISRAVDLVRQIARGLEVAHRERIIHRDLKPKNLILCRRSDGTDLVKIVDFGIAKLAGTEPSAGTTTTGNAPGTPHYMSPEQARGDKNLDERTDIYALGVIAYELLSGKKPHPGDSYNAIIYQILSKQPVPLREHRPEVPEGLARVVSRAMATDPADRFESVRQLERALAPYAPESPSVLLPEDETLAGSSRRPLSIRTERRTMLWGWVALGAVGVIVAAWVWSRSTPAAEARSEPAPTAPASEPVPTRTEPAPPAPTPPTPSSAAAASPSPSLAQPPAATQGAAPPRPRSVPPHPVAPKGSASVDWHNPYE